MKILRDNSMYCTEPPEVIIEPMTPPEYEKFVIECHLDEEREYLNGFLDIDDEQCSELIKWKELKK